MHVHMWQNATEHRSQAALGNPFSLLRSQLTKPQVVQVFLGLGSSCDCCLYSKEGPIGGAAAAAVFAVDVKHLELLLPETSNLDLRPTSEATADTEVLIEASMGRDKRVWAFRRIARHADCLFGSPLVCFACYCCVLPPSIWQASSF